jgi:hypothetical protein
LAFITFTDDTDRPKTITFGGSPLVRWYLYLRNPSRDLYMRREDNGVLAAEVFIVEPIDPPLPDSPLAGIEDMDVVVDPNDATKARIYWTSDGTVWCVVVTSSPIGEQPTKQVFDRQSNRFDLYTVGDNPGGAYKTSGDTERALESRVSQTFETEPNVMELYRAIDNTSYALYVSTTFVGTFRQFVFEVPANTVATPADFWKARVLQVRPGEIRSGLFSLPARDTDQPDTDVYPVGDNPGAAFFASGDEGAGGSRWLLTTVFPLKEFFNDPATYNVGDNPGSAFFASGDEGAGGSRWQYTTVFPLKEFLDDPATYNVGDNPGGAYFRIVFNKARSFAIVAVSVGNQEFEVLGDKTFELFGGVPITVVGSTGNDGNYTTDTVTFNGTNTVIKVDQAVPSAVADGALSYTARGVT